MDSECRVAFALYGINRKALAEALDLNLAGVNRWFRVDDIAISYIFEIAELYGLKVPITAPPSSARPSAGKNPLPP